MSNDVQPLFEKTDVFLPGENYGTVQAGLLVTRKGTAIAPCQKRKGSMEDSGHDIDILANLSNDGGKTWDGQQVIFTERISVARFNLEWLTSGKKGWPFNLGNRQ